MKKKLLNLIMTLNEFKDLDEAEQIEIFWDAIDIGSYQKDGYTFECKQVDDFYVEYKLKGTQYIDMRCHRDTNLLDPFLDNSSSDLKKE